MSKPAPSPAPAEWVAAFVAEVEKWSPRHVGLVDESVGHWYFTRGDNPAHAALAYVHHRPGVALK